MTPDLEVYLLTFNGRVQQNFLDLRTAFDAGKHLLATRMMLPRRYSAGYQVYYELVGRGRWDVLLYVKGTTVLTGCSIWRVNLENLP